MNGGRVTLNAVGDICLGDSLISLGFGVRSTLAEKGPAHLFDRAAPVLREADFLFGNLECVLSDEGWDDSDPKTRYLRGSPTALEALAPLDFDVLNVANNHTLQYGKPAWEETLSRIRGRGIRTLGSLAPGPGGSPRSEPVVLERNGVRIGLLGYSYEREQYFPGPPLYAVGDRDVILEDLGRLRPEVDFTVVSLHWGLEYMSYPSRDMVLLARALVDAGCDAVLGHHPHVLQGVERHGRGVIAYSLGNFVFDKMWWDPCRDTAVVRLTFTAGRERRTDLERIPFRINRQFQPEIPQGPDTAALNRRLAALDRSIEKDFRSRPVSYARRQKFILQRLNATKMRHILLHLPRYRSDVRRHLLVRKVLRIP